MSQPSIENRVLQIDLDQAQHFLAMLAPDETVFLFTAFDDDQDRKRPAVTLFGTLKEHLKRLSVLNNQGYGIFILVNQSQGKSRKLEDITGHRAVWVENDSGNDSNTPVQSNFTVESSLGKYHEYFLVSEMDFFQRIALQEKLVVEHHSDPAAADASRVLRLPGFYHQKKSERKGLAGDPHLVTIIEETDGIPLKATDLLAMFDMPSNFSDLIKASPKAAVQYTQLVSEILSVQVYIEHPDRYTSSGSQAYKLVKRVFALMSIGNDENHELISSASVETVLHALDNINGDQLDQELQVEAISCLQNIEEQFKQTGCEQELKTVEFDAVDDLRYLHPAVEIQKIRTALFLIDPNERETWINVGLALKAHLGPYGVEMWDEWSKGSLKYNPSEISKLWRGFHPTGIAIGTVFHLAKKQLNYRVDIDVKNNVLTEGISQQWLEETTAELNLSEYDQLKKHLKEYVDAKLQVLSFGLTPAEMLIKQPYKPNWLVKGVMEQDSLIHIFGKPASGKSFIVLSLAYAIGTGTDWFESEVTQGGVVYLAGEGKAGLSKRLKVLGEHHGQNVKNVFISDLPAQLVDQTNVNEVVESIKVICPNVKLVIVDTLHRNMGAGDENSAEDFAVFLSHLSQLMAINGTSVVIVHHSGHGDSNRGRGTSAITAAMDMEYMVKRTGEKITMSCTKSKDHDEPKSMAFDMLEVDTGWVDEEDSPVKSIVLERSLASSFANVGKLNEKDKRVLAALARAQEVHGVPLPLEVESELTERGHDEFQMPNKVVHIDEWKKLVYPELDVSGTSTNPDDAKRKAFQRAREKLRAQDRIELSGDYWWEVNQ